MKKWLFIILIILALVVAVATADAKFFNQGPGSSGIFRIIKSLDLTDVQKTSVANILKENRAQLYQAHEKLRTRTEQLKKAILTEPYDEIKIRDCFKEAALAGEKLTILVAKIIPLIKAELTEEQIGEIQEIKKLVNQAMPKIIAKRKAGLNKWIERHAQ